MDKYIVGLFDDDEVLLKAVKAVRNAKEKIHDVLTPYPVHGLDAAMGLKDSRLHTVGFIAGFTGAVLGLAFIIWTNTISYPTNFGGKPLLSLPSYIPITFEVTVLSASVTMVVAFFVRCGLSIFKTPKIFDERTTDDKMAMIFSVNEETTDEQINKIKGLLTENGAVEVNIKDFDESEY